MRSTKIVTTLFSCFALVAILLSGCGDDMKVSYNPPPGGANPTAPNTSGGGSPPPPAASGGSNPSPPPPAASGGSRRSSPPPPTMSGGGGQPAPSGNSGNSDAAPAGDDFIPGGLANGFYPQLDGFNKSGFGGGLVPQNVGLHELGPDSSEGTASTTTSNPGNSDANSFVDDLIEEAGMKEMDKGFMSLAEKAFAKRNDGDAFQYLYAHVLTKEEAKAKYPVKWYPATAKGKPPIGPKVAYRWGVGVVYTAPSSLEGKPPVIGDPASAKPAGGRGGGNMSGLADAPSGSGPGSSGGGDSPYAYVNTNMPEGFLLYYTGDYGDRLLDRLERKRKSSAGYYGAILRDVNVDYVKDGDEVAPPEKKPTRSGTRRLNGRRGGGGASAPSMGGGSAPSNSGGGNRGNANRRAAAGGGNASGVAGNTTVKRVDRVSGSEEAVRPNGDMVGSLIPGVTLVGEGSKDELIERSVELGLDGLLIFSVRVSSGRKQVGSAGLRAINLRSPGFEEIAKGRMLKVDDVAKKRESGGSDPVDIALNELFNEGTDQIVKAGPLPKLNSESVKKRIGSLLSKTYTNPLPVAVEIANWHKLNLIDDQYASKAMVKLLGSAGKALVDGDEASRTAAIMEWLPADK